MVEVTKYNMENENIDIANRKQVNAIFVKGVHKKTEGGLAWKENSFLKQQVSVLLDTGSSINLISARCCTKMNLGKPLPPTKALVDFGGRTIKTLGLVDLNLQVGGIVKEIRRNSRSLRSLHGAFPQNM